MVDTGQCLHVHSRKRSFRISSLPMDILQLPLFSIDILIDLIMLRMEKLKHYTLSWQSDIHQ